MPAPWMYPLLFLGALWVLVVVGRIVSLPLILGWALFKEGRKG